MSSDLTDEQLGQMIADLDQLKRPTVEDCRAAFLELRERRHHAVGAHLHLAVAAERARDVLTEALKEAAQ